MAEPCFAWTAGTRNSPQVLLERSIPTVAAVAVKTRRARVVHAEAGVGPALQRDDVVWGAPLRSEFNASLQASRRCRPRVCQRAKGARALKHCDPVATNGQPSAPAPVACRAEGAVTSSAGSSVRPGALRPSLSRPGPRAAALRKMERRCRRASVRSVAIAHSLDPRPRNLELSLSSATDAHDGTDACLNRAPPPPRKAAQLMRPMMGRGASKIERYGAPGISFSVFRLGGR